MPKDTKQKSWEENAYYLGDREDGVFFNAVKAGSKWKVKAKVKSETAYGQEWELPVEGEFDSYKAAVESGICHALEWCMAYGVWVSAKNIEAVREKLKENNG